MMDIPNSIIPPHPNRSAPDSSGRRSLLPVGEGIGSLSHILFTGVPHNRQNNTPLFVHTCSLHRLRWFVVTLDLLDFGVWRDNSMRGYNAGSNRSNPSFPRR